jgi:peptidoglycan lytic transglycosylase A
MRISCFLILMLFGTLSVRAQSVTLDRGEAIAGAKTQSDKSVTRDRHVATKVISLTKRFRPVETPTIVPDPFRISNSQLETINWSELSGWTDDDHTVAFATFHNSCKAIVRGTPPRYEGQPLYAALQSVCRRAINSPPRDLAAARVFFEKHFRPMRIAPLGENNGILTGYYEPIIEGSLVPSAKFTVPLYRTPPELINYEPGTYYDRNAIENGALAGRDLEICWLKDSSDLLSAQIEGSARVKLEGGKVLRLNYNGHNGWPYMPVERILTAREIALKEESSMVRIRERIDANPKEGKELRRSDKSYVFFRETSLTEHEEPLGAQGIPLTPGRSIATDKNIHVYGTPFFIEAVLPIEKEKSATKFKRLMVSQDSGGAIIGPARADLYFGAGNRAAHIAGRIRHPGQFTILIPREIDPVIAGQSTPLPRPRPAFAGTEEKPVKTSEQHIP